ncbi:MAG TPA: sugar ABC transporter permease [Actinocrinis sp.]
MTIYGATAPTAAPPAGGRRPRSGGRGRSHLHNRSTPYLLLGPAVVMILAVLGYPLVEVVILSFQNWRNQNPYSTTQNTPFTFSNYTDALSSGQFWTVTVRTILVTAVMVGASLLLGMLVAQLMTRISKWARAFVMFGLVLVWSVPTLISTIDFQWMFSQAFGLVNYLTNDFGHDWFSDSTSGFGVISFLVVWGALPMIAIMFYAALTQVPRELVEAARVDGANRWHVFRFVVEPIIRPIVLIMLALSVFWDAQVFVQIYNMFNDAPPSAYYTLGIWSYIQGYGQQDYGTAATLTIVTVLILLTVSVPYLRQLIKIGDGK